MDGHRLSNQEQVSFGLLEATDIEGSVESVDWSDSMISRCRFASPTISDTRFERVVITDSDLSGVIFSNCLLRDCLIIGAKARFHLAFDNCILDGLTLVQCHTDRLEIVESRLASVDFMAATGHQLMIHQCQPYKKSGRVSFMDCRFDAVGGLDVLGGLGVSVVVDAQMWNDLGDQYLREKGIQQREDAGPPLETFFDNLTKNL